MFSRNFMKIFAVRKFGNITASTNMTTTHNYFVSPLEINVARIPIYLMVPALLWGVNQTLHTFEEFFGEVPRAHSHTQYEHDVPASVRVPNDQIIEDFHKLHQAQAFEKTINYEK